MANTTPRRDDRKAVGAGEAREPTHARQVDHDEAVELAFEHGVAKPVSPACTVSFGRSPDGGKRGGEHLGVDTDDRFHAVGSVEHEGHAVDRLLVAGEKSINSVSVSCSGTVVGSS